MSTRAPGVERLLEDIVGQGIDLWFEGDRLRFRAPKGALLAEQRAALTGAPRRRPRAPSRRGRGVSNDFPLVQPAARSGFCTSRPRREHRVPRHDLRRASVSAVALPARSARRSKRSWTATQASAPPTCSGRREPLRSASLGAADVAFDSAPRPRRHATTRSCARPVEADYALPLRPRTRPRSSARSLLTPAPTDVTTVLLAHVVHHIAADGWSLMILFDELSQALRRGHRGRPPPPPAARLTVHRLRRRGRRIRRSAAPTETDSGPTGATKARPPNAPASPPDRPSPAAHPDVPRGVAPVAPWPGADREPPRALAPRGNDGVRPPSRLVPGVSCSAALPAPTIWSSGRRPSRAASRNHMPVVGDLRQLGPPPRKARPDDDVSRCARRRDCAPPSSRRSRPRSSRSPSSFGASSQSAIRAARPSSTRSSSSSASTSSKICKGSSLAARRGAVVAAGGLRLAAFPLPQQEGQFDLALQMVERGGALHGVVEYSTDLFDEATIRRFAAAYIALVEAANRDPNIALAALPGARPRRPDLASAGALLGRACATPISASFSTATNSASTPPKAPSTEALKAIIAERRNDLVDALRGLGEIAAGGGRRGKALKHIPRVAPLPLSVGASIVSGFWTASNPAAPTTPSAPGCSFLGPLDADLLQRAVDGPRRSPRKSLRTRIGERDGAPDLRGSRSPSARCSKGSISPRCPPRRAPPKPAASRTTARQGPLRPRARPAFRLPSAPPRARRACPHDRRPPTPSRTAGRW